MNSEQMAEEHAEWYTKHFSKLIFTVYKDAFIHGYKHGKEDTE
jgi:hypothetical protein